jgi:phosphoglycolate phosphatase
MTTASRFRAAVFDLDGTLLDTLDDLGDSTNAILAARGYPTHPMESYKTFVGGGAGVLVSRAMNAIDGVELTDELHTALLAEFKIEYKQRWNDKTLPYDGIAKLLVDVDSLGLRCAILSNKPHAFTKLCVEANFPEGQFEVVQGVDDSTPPKPDLTGLNRILDGWSVAPGEVVYLGDTGVDMKTASAAGCLAVGVTWGFRGRDELAANGADVIIDHPSELAALLLK